MLQSKPCRLFVIRSEELYRIVQEKALNDDNELSEELRMLRYRGKVYEKCMMRVVCYNGGRWGDIAV